MSNFISDNFISGDRVKILRSQDEGLIGRTATIIRDVHNFRNQVSIVVHSDRNNRNYIPIFALVDSSDLELIEDESLKSSITDQLTDLFDKLDTEHAHLKVQMSNIQKELSNVGEARQRVKVALDVIQELNE